MTNQITIRKSVAQSDRDNIPEIMQIALSFIKKKYPTVDFNKVDFIFSGSFCRGRYYRNKEKHHKYEKPTIQIPTQHDDEKLYWKPSLGMVRDVVKEIGRYDVTIAVIIHELTHHAQYELGLSHGELETTRNQLDYYKEYRPDVYALFMDTEYVEPLVETII